jgi:hypothetical protein
VWIGHLRQKKGFKMTITVHSRIKILIEETSDAFTSCGSVNADYAEFAALALGEFKHVLRSPGLTPRQLTGMLRSGLSKHKEAAEPGLSWTAFLADYIADAANKNAAAAAERLG